MNNLTCAVLGSGSEANSYVFRWGTTTIVIDNGFSLREFSRRANLIGVDPGTITALFLTHTHGDHARGVEGLSRRARAPVYMSSQIERNGSYVKKLFRHAAIDPGETLEFGDIGITAFPLSHDSVGAQSYRLDLNGIAAVLITDTVKVTREMHALAFEADYLFLEANYNEHMLRTGPYPAVIKQRIRSEVGLLSNLDAMRFLNDLSLSASLQKVYFCHLSKVNNSPEVLKEDIKGHLEHSIVWQICPRGELVRVEMSI